MEQGIAEREDAEDPSELDLAQMELLHDGAAGNRHVDAVEVPEGAEHK